MISFTDGGSSDAPNSEVKDPKRNGRQSTNIAGYFGQPLGQNLSQNRISMPVKTVNNPRFGAEQEDSEMRYIPPPSNGDQRDTEIEEEVKGSTAENNEELFKHLSYLSQLNNDVSKH